MKKKYVQQLSKESLSEETQRGNTTKKTDFKLSAETSNEL